MVKKLATGTLKLAFDGTTWRHTLRFSLAAGFTGDDAKHSVNIIDANSASSVELQTRNGFVQILA